MLSSRPQESRTRCDACAGLVSGGCGEPRRGGVPSLSGCPRGSRTRCAACAGLARGPWSQLRMAAPHMTTSLEEYVEEVASSACVHTVSSFSGGSVRFLSPSLGSSGVVQAYGSGSSEVRLRPTSGPGFAEIAPREAVPKAAPARGSRLGPEARGRRRERAGQQAGRLAGRSAGWSVGQSAGRLVGQSAGQARPV